VKSLILIFAITLISYAKTPAVKKLGIPDDGWYFQAHGNFCYYVDVKAKICYMTLELPSGGGGGLVVIDSEKLKNREEWKAIITW